MARYAIWDKTSTLIAPSGQAFTAEQVVAKYAWAGIEGVDAIITSGAISMGVFMEYEQTKRYYTKLGAAITDGMTQAEVLDAIEAFEDTPPVPEEPTTEERTAAALEYIAMSSLPDETV